MLDVISVGSATVDAFVYTDKSRLIEKKAGCAEKDFIAYPAGSKLLINRLSFSTGGGGTNTAVAFSRLGHKAGYLGILGKDENADNILRILKKEKVSFLGKKQEGMCGYSIILDSIGHDRTILAYKGVNDEFSINQKECKKLKAKWFYLSSMVGKSYPSLETIASYAKKHSIKVAFNPSTYLAEKGASYLGKLLKNVDVVVLNKEEAGLITRKEKVEEQLDGLRKLGPKIAIVTNGPEGAYASDGINYYFVKAKKMKVFESTGAGDAFASTFVSGMLRKKSVEYALKMALANATAVLNHHGAKENLQGWSNLQKQLRWVKVRIWQRK